MTEDFNHFQMNRLINRYLQFPDDNQLPLSLVYVHVGSDYWESQYEFVKNFVEVPLDHYVVVHVRFEGLSFTASGLRNCIEQLIAQQGRDNSKIFVFTPNSMTQDHPWVNLFYNGFSVITDEIYRAQEYLVPSVELDLKNLKTWALFVGRKTTVRMLGLWHMTHMPETKDDCIVSLMQETAPPDRPNWLRLERYYDHIGRWKQSDIVPDLDAVLDWMKQPPIVSVDGVYVGDQYIKHVAGENRNSTLVDSVLSFRNQYLFEITFETMTEGFTFTPSEKTVRTLVAEKPLFVYAAPGFLKGMQNLGFQTFDTLWDESYDNLSGPERFSAMFFVIKNIAQLPAQQKLELYQATRSICQHNRCVLEDWINKINKQ
jgi:hypothetical protein